MTEDLDVFAEAFAEIAEQSYKEAPEATVEWLREYITRRAEQDGKVPDVLIVTMDQDHNEIHNNGIASERIVWLSKVAEFSALNILGED